MECNRPRVVCAICGIPIYALASREKRFYFRHRTEDGSCPALTRTGLTEADIRAMKYRGAQESDAHRRLKDLIKRSLHADQRFADVKVEATWRSSFDLSALRRPDVQAWFAGKRFAFEAQLSTTFLDVVIGRKIFYRAEGALLVWVLPYFDPGYRKLTVDDILFNNNSNILVVDRETTEASEATGKLTFRCTYGRTISSKCGLKCVWESRLVVWDELICDFVNQTIFAFDSEGEELKVAVLRALTEHPLHRGPDWGGRWADIARRLALRGHRLHSSYVNSELRNLVCGVLSAQAGRPVGSDFDRLIELAHHLAQCFPSTILTFGHAVRLAKNQSLLEQQDKSGKWEKRTRAMGEAIRQGDSSYSLQPEVFALLQFLFPEIANSCAAFSASLSVNRNGV